MPRDARLLLEDIRDAALRIDSYITGMTYEDFVHDERTVDAVVRNIEIIGEAAKNLPDDVRALAPEIEWELVMRMRDRLAHRYFGVEVEIVWDAAEEHVPHLLDVVQSMLDTA